MTTWALVPLKSFAQAKLRLADRLDGAQRASLALHMAAHVLDTLHAEPRLAGVAVVSADDGVRRWARTRGAVALPEPGLGLNDALARGARELQHLGATRLLVVPGDLPLLAGADVARLLEREGADRVIIVPAARDGGTNALLVTLPVPIPFCFGPDSAARHRAQAVRHRVRAAVFPLSSFEQDIDVADDLVHLRDPAYRYASAGATP